MSPRHLIEFTTNLEQLLETLSTIPFLGGEGKFFGFVYFSHFEVLELKDPYV